MNILQKTSSALCWSYFERFSDGMPQYKAIGCDDFVQQQVRAMPGYLKPAFTILAVAINALSLAVARGLFIRISPQGRIRVMALWGKLPGPAKDFLRFYKTLSIFYIYSEMYAEGNHA